MQLLFFLDEYRRCSFWEVSLESIVLKERIELYQSQKDGTFSPLERSVHSEAATGGVL